MLFIFVVFVYVVSSVIAAQAKTSCPRQSS